MSDVQLLLLTGRATKDGEIKETKKDKPFGVFTLAANRYLGKEKGEEATFYNCISFSKNIDKIISKIKKGTKLHVSGRPEADAYKNKEEEAIGSLRVVVDNIDILS